MPPFRFEMLTGDSRRNQGCLKARTCRCPVAQPLRLCPRMNRIAVVGDKSISAQARTYAEYRVFAILTRHTRDFRSVRVLLGQRDGPGKCDTVTCSVTVILKPSGSIRTRVTGPHAYAAINRAVARLGSALGGRVEQRRRHARRSAATETGRPLDV